MTSPYESRIDRQIREAQERGDFDDLPGAGRPLPGYGEEYREDWWIKELIRRENLTGALPETLALRRETEDLPQAVAKEPTESAVRERVAALNERIRQAQRGLATGPSVALATVDADEVVRAWRAARAT